MPDSAAEAQRITGGRGVDFIVENGGAGTIKQNMEAIAFGEIISVIGFLASIPDIMIGSKQMLEDVVRFVGATGVDVPVEKTFEFTKKDVVKAFEYLESVQHIGKVCINVD
ncbi:alcohol dehydrogenase [Diplodia corticola]|uniref:Alcohol dehydrogenase n=1 Tax=Diplodia corticola TaxID=236234 RepID=A0A1J9R9G5_9PEZI|nr:alcohol dehydrogenase [Diplodia corticola]OJD29067.1 alcohol dehydrogenase [Diplodia corticola]